MSDEDVKSQKGVKADGTSYRVLVVDDSLFILKQLSQILTTEGFDVVGSATNGIDALEQYDQLQPDIVTLDITMPEMGGMEVLEAIIERSPNAKVIMVSSMGNQDIVKKCLLLGAKNYIVKPLDRKKVLDRLLYIL